LALTAFAAYVVDNNPFSVLDIGAGTGILSLMLAQQYLNKLTL
jgi:tRNA1(Val) A37 N6-methylase TrmN6